MKIRRNLDFLRKYPFNSDTNNIHIFKNLFCTIEYNIQFCNNVLFNITL